MLDKSGTAQVFYYCYFFFEQVVKLSGWCIVEVIILCCQYLLLFLFYVVGTPWSSNVLAMCNVLRKAASPATPAFAD